MRMRKKKNGAARIAACADLLIQSPEENLFKSPQSVFSKERPLCLEIGCGKGDFITGMSIANKDLNFIAMEKVPDVACLALEKAKRTEDMRENNLKFIIGDAKNLTEYLPMHCLDRIYINFCDPWPKKGHEKRRLTYKDFLQIYKNLLTPGGMLYFKTDNEELFDYSLASFEEFGLIIEWLTRNLHESEKNEYNIMTEYERNFSQKGFKICSAWVRF